MRLKSIGEIAVMHNLVSLANNFEKFEIIEGRKNH